MMFETLKEDLIAGKFALSLSHCELRQCGTDSPKVYSGAAFVSQKDDGILELRMFATEELDERERLARFMPMLRGLTPGVIIPDTSYYDLKAVDQEGRVWRADRQTIKEIFGKGNEIHVPLLRDLEVVESTPSTATVKGWFVQSSFELPWHLYTQTERRTTLDRFEFEDAAYAWNVHKKEDGINVQLTVKGQSLEPSASRFLQALSMLVGMSLPPLISYSVANGELITRIHLQTKRKHSKLEPPIELRYFEHDAAHRFLACCLQRAEQHQPSHKDQLLVLYRFWYRILRAHQEDIENSSLVLSVAIEGILKTLCHSEHDTDPIFSEIVAKEAPKVKSLELDERVIASMIKSLENAVTPKPKDTLIRLKDQGVIAERHIAAWGKMRNTGAHGTLLEDDLAKFQKHLNLYFCCLDLFYRLMLLAIGYHGKYVDRSLAGWPAAEFPSPVAVRAKEIASA